jgi:hypothetical protein
MTLKKHWFIKKNLSLRLNVTLRVQRVRFPALLRCLRVWSFQPYVTRGSATSEKKRGDLNGYILVVDDVV